VRLNLVVAIKTQPAAAVKLWYWRAKTECLILNFMSYKIGKTAELAGVNKETIRYYEKRKLISPPARRRSGYREFSRLHIDEIKFIKRAQELGFTLSEIKELLQLKVDEDTDCKEVRSRAEEKRKAVSRKIENLVEIKKALETLIKRCKSDRSTNECAILKTLNGEYEDEQRDT